MNIASTQQPLFTPVRMGKLELPNRIVMAPLTRMRAANPGHARSWNIWRPSLLLLFLTGSRSRWYPGMQEPCDAKAA
jgi:hypothetical protein